MGLVIVVSLLLMLTNLQRRVICTCSTSQGNTSWLTKFSWGLRFRERRISTWGAEKLPFSRQGQSRRLKTKKLFWLRARTVEPLRTFSRRKRRQNARLTFSRCPATSNVSFKVARDSCDVTHSLTQASIDTSHVHASKKLYKVLTARRAINQQTHKCHYVVHNKELVVRVGQF